MEKRSFGATGGREASLYTLKNARGTRLSLTDYGASVVSLLYQGTDVVLGWESAVDYEKNAGAFLGATVGRNANRIAKAAFTLDGREYRLGKNDGENNLHSGPDSYSTRFWQVVQAAEDNIVFFMDSPDGDQGFPGRLRLWVTYILTDGDEIRIRYRGDADKATPVNITNHTYFNLNGRGSILDHTLELFAGSFTPGGPGLIPTGEIRSVTGTPFDFRTPHPIGRDIEEEDRQLQNAGGYDHNFLIEGDGLRPAAILRADQSHITLEILTDAPAMQVYTGNFLAGERGKGGAVYTTHSGVALETQFCPNAVNESTFASPVLRPGMEYRAETVWRLSQR